MSKKHGHSPLWTVTPAPRIAVWIKWNNSNSRPGVAFVNIIIIGLKFYLFPTSDQTSLPSHLVLLVEELQVFGSTCWFCPIVIFSDPEKFHTTSSSLVYSWDLNKLLSTWNFKEKKRKGPGDILPSPLSTPFWISFDSCILEETFHFVDIAEYFLHIR